MTIPRKILASLTLLLTLGLAACGGGSTTTVAPDLTVGPDITVSPDPSGMIDPAASGGAGMSPEVTPGY